MTQIGYLNAKFDADVASFIKDMGRAADASEKTAKLITGAFKAMNTAVGAFGVSMSAGAIFGKMLEESRQAEDAAKKVEAILKATGGAAGVTAKQVDDLASQYSKLTGLDDDVIKGGEAMLLTFKNIGKDVFPQATQAMLDMSETMGQDLKASAVQLGKALNDPKEGLSALQRIGVTFSESQKEVIKSLVETGQTAKAQAIILQEIQSEMGGTAAAARDTLSGALKALDTAFGNLFETLGSTGAFDLTRTGIETLVMGVEALSDAIASNDFKQWLNGVTSAMDVAYQYSKPLLNALINIVDLIGKLPKSPVEFGERLGKALSGKGKFEDILGFTGKDIGKDYLSNFENKVLKGIEDMHERAKKAGAHVGKAVADGFDGALEKHKKEHKEKSKGWLLSGGSGADLFEDKGRPSNGWMNKGSDSDLLFTDQSSDKLKEINAELEQELEKQKLITADNKEQLMHLEAQRKLKDIIFGTDEERAKAEQHIVDIMKAQKELQAEQAAGEALKTMQETNEALAAKVAGMEDEYNAYKKIQDVVKDVEDPVKKQEYIDKVKDQIAQEKLYKDQLETQQKTLDAIKNSTGGYIQKQRDLYNAWQAGTINGKQWAQTLDEIRKKQIDTVQKGVKDFTMHVFDSFSKAIMEGKKLKDVFKDLGKELALLAAKKLLFEPVSNAIGNLAAKWYGNTIFGTPGGGGSGGGNQGGSGGGITNLFKNIFGGGSKKGSPTAPGGSKDPNWASGGGDKLTLLTDAVIGIRNTLDFVKISTSSGLALKVWEAHLGMPVDNKQPTTFKNPFRSANNGGSTGSSGGLTVNADALVPLIQSLIGSSKDGPAWKVIMPDCPCGTGLAGTGLAGTGLAGTAPGNIGGLMPSGGLGGPMPFDNSANETARAAHFAQANAAQMALGFGRTAAAPGASGNSYLSSQQTQLYLKGLADQSNRNLTAGYQAGNVSYAQLQNYQGAWSNALSTQAAMGYSATPNWLKGLNGGSFEFAGGTGIMGTQLNMAEEGSFTPGLTGAISGKPMYAPYGGGSFSGGTAGPYFNHDAFPAIATLSGYGGGGFTSSRGSRGSSTGGFTSSRGSRGSSTGGFTSSRGSRGSSTGGGSGVMPFTGINDPNPLNATAARWGMNGAQQLSPVNPYDYSFIPNGRKPIFGFADGGSPPLNVPSLVGERGPELFVPTQSGTVLSNERLKSVMGGNAAPVVNLHDYTSTASQVSSTQQAADGSLHITLRDAVAGMMSDPRVLRAQQRATGVKARGNRRGN